MTLLAKDERVKIFYKQLGNRGPWITLINGYTRSCADFNQFAKKLVDAGFRVLIFDNRGSGNTVSPLNFTFVDMVQDIEALWRHLGVNKSHVVAFSMGGIIAQCLGAKLPKKILSLVLVSSTGEPGALGINRGWPASFKDVLKKLKGYVNPCFFQDNTLLMSSMAKQIVKMNIDGDFNLRAIAQGQALSGMGASLLSLQEFKAPALVIHGVDDQIIPVKYARDLAANITNAKTILYEGLGHLLLIENNQKLIFDVLEFILEHSRQKALKA